MISLTGMPIIIAGLNLAGSLSSFVGAGFILITYMILPRRRHFRHVLILNLATADFLNALNESISGLYMVITKKPLTSSPLCTTNGFIVQLMTQATDCAILAIAVTTIIVVTRFKLQTPDAIWKKRKVALVSAAIWALPATTACIALATHSFGPASGSWCWIMQKPIYLRYVLTHGWKCLFIFTEIALYAYLHFFLRRHFRYLSRVMNNSSPGGAIGQHQAQDSDILKPSSELVLVELRSGEVDESKWVPKVHVVSHRTERCDPRYRPVQRILLLNAYPVAYIILWIPGIANRLVEMTGHKSYVTQALQASTQFVGLANALTYGWNESIARRLWRKSIVHREPRENYV